MKAILRVAKIKGESAARGKSQHNYREKDIANADPTRMHLNGEYISTNRDIWKDCNERILVAGVSRKVKGDAVRGMEFILTASPEYFKRDSQGNAYDIDNSAWFRKNFDFMETKYGKNLVAFTLHQDEKTPHIHAIVVPITEDNRLSAKNLFNPNTLRALQTEYAEAMKPLGLERGVPGSKAIHQEMRKVYGSERQVLEQVNQVITIEKPTGFDLLNLTEWAKNQETRANQLLQKAQKLAVENATAKTDMEALKKRLNTAEALKQQNFDTTKDLSRKLNDTYIAVSLGKTNTIKEIGNKMRLDIRNQVTEDFFKIAINMYGHLRTLEETIVKVAEFHPQKYSLRRDENNKISGLNLKESSQYFSISSILPFYEQLKEQHQSQEKNQEHKRGLDFSR